MASPGSGSSIDRSVLLEFESAKMVVKLGSSPEEYLAIMEEQLRRVQGNLKLTIDYSR